ncbi:hypothetical protein COO60DRAFT_144935 [Scenedesmus sp. NREL 46B-D3]|nr:hypothetical protein COO60DRAFT_144935 [Scenedesmus sp. NREL 46B-D3]
MEPGTSLPIDLGVVGSGPFVFEMLSPPLNGQLTNITSDSLTTFTPDFTYCSMFDYYDGFYYTVYDKYGQFADAAVTINVVCPDPPTAESQNFETPAQTPLEQRLQVNSTAELFFDISLYPSYGSVDGVDERRVSVYTPDYDWCSFQDALDNWGFDVTDLFGQYTFALVFIKVTCPPPPKPQDQVIRLPAQLGLVINVTLNIVSGAAPFYIETSIDPMNGYLGPIMVNDSNPLVATTTFTPYDGFCNYEDVADPFNWIVYDPFGQAGEATCSVILRCPDPPTARDQSVQLAVGETERLIKLQVTGAPPLDYLIYAPPGNGKLTRPTIDNTVVYTPNWDFCSVEGFLDTVYYMVSDAFGATADGSMSINVLCPSPPTADDSYFAMNANTPVLEIKPGYGPAGGNLTLKVASQPDLGAVMYDAARNMFTYAPTNGGCSPGKTDDFVFAVDDAYGQQTAYGIVTIECLRARRRGRLLMEAPRRMLALAGRRVRRGVGGGANAVGFSIG